MLIVLSAVLTMSLVLVAVGGLTAAFVYALTDSLEAGVATGLVGGFLSWLVVYLMPDLLVVLPEDL